MQSFYVIISVYIRRFSIVNHTIATVENMMLMITDLSKTIEELNATIIALQANIQS